MLAEIADGEEEEEGEWNDEEEEEEELQGHPVEVLRCLGREIASLAKRASSKFIPIPASPAASISSSFSCYCRMFLNLSWIQVPQFATA